MALPDQGPAAVDTSAMDSGQLAEAMANGSVAPVTIDPSTLSAAQLEELIKQGILPAPGGDSFDSDATVELASQASAKKPVEGRFEAEDHLDPDATDGGNTAGSDAAQREMEAAVRHEAELAAQQGATGSDAASDFQHLLDEGFDGYQSTDVDATVEALKKTYGADADINQIAQTAKHDIAAADAAAAGRPIAADAMIFSTQPGSTTVMASHMMAKADALSVLGLDGKAGLTMRDVNQAFKDALRTPGADRDALMSARSFLRSDFAAQGEPTGGLAASIRTDHDDASSPSLGG